MKTKLKLTLLVTVLVVVVVMSGSTAFADTGPKPSVHISFKNVQGNFYCTLLSPGTSSGPFIEWDGTDETLDKIDVDTEIFLAFANYVDKDGYHFLQYLQLCNQNKSFVWGYHPPSTFKVLVYFPQTDTFFVSESYTRYAFNSYYKVDLGNADASQPLQLTNNYNYFREIALFLLRAALTVGLEICVALLFGLKQKRTLKVVVIVNVCTQVLLNIFLNVVIYYQGWLALFFLYFVAELLVYIVETVVFCMVLSGKNKVVLLWKSFVYPLVANLVSFVAGMFLWLVFV